MKFTFRRDDESGLIHVKARVSELFDEALLILDTGASYTTFDRDVLWMAGYSLDNPIDKISVETTKGVMEMDLFEIESLTVCGITRHNLKIAVYDFLTYGITSNYQGVLGLDFFEGTRFTVDMVDNTITVEQL